MAGGSTASIHAHMRVWMSLADACPAPPWYRQLASPSGHSMSSIAGMSPGCGVPSTERKCCAWAAPSSVGSKKWYALRYSPAALAPDQFAVKVDCVLYVPCVALIIAKSTPAAFTDVQSMVPLPS